MGKLSRRQMAALLAAVLLVGLLGMGALADENSSSGKESLDVSQSVGTDGSGDTPVEDDGSTQPEGSGDMEETSGSSSEEDPASSSAEPVPEEPDQDPGDASQESGSSSQPEEPEEPEEISGSSGEDPASSSSESAPEGPDQTTDQDPAAEELIPGATVGDPPLDTETTPPLPSLPDLDDVNSISFSNVRSRIREHNLDYQSLQGSILTIEEIDYDETHEQLRQAMNELAANQWSIVQMGSLGLIGEYEKNSTLAAMDQQYAALKEQFDAIENGEMQEDNAGAVRQLKNLQNQIVLGGESMYIALVELEQSRGTLDRNLATLDRSITELELRYKLGQISAMTLQETKGNRTSLLSGQKTLEMNIRNLKYQFESLLGAEMKGTIKLGALPEVSGEEISSMSLERDLETAKKNSYELYDAARTREDAYETYKETGDNYGYHEEYAEYRSAQREWQAAQNSYQTTVQNFELSFRTLYEQVKDYKQVLDASRTALAVKKSNYQASELKYQQGNISKNALLNSQDEVDAAQETVNGAVIDLFSSYNTYRWAVDYGILN